MIEYFKILVPAVALIASYLLKSWLDNRALFKKLESIDKQQNEKIETLSETLKTHVAKEEEDRAKVNEVYELLKHKPFFGKLSTLLTKRVHSQIRGQKAEISESLFKTLKEIKPYLQEVLECDFNGLDEDIIYIELSNRVGNFEQPIRKFAFDLVEISKTKSNGERRKSFEEISIEFIDKYIEYSIKNKN
jgi:hypothetical protein